MHINAKVTDLSPQQWDCLQDNLPTSQDMVRGVVRVCATFEATAGWGPVRHVEISALELASLLGLLEHVALVRAALTPDALPDTEAGQEPLPGYPDKADDPGQAARDRANHPADDLLNEISEFSGTEHPDDGFDRHGVSRYEL